MVARHDCTCQKLCRALSHMRISCNRERHVWMPIKSPLSGARRADLTGFGVHRCEAPALPKSVERGNLARNKAVVRRTISAGRGGQALSRVTRRGGEIDARRVF